MVLVLLGLLMALVKFCPVYSKVVRGTYRRDTVSGIALPPEHYFGMETSIQNESHLPFNSIHTKPTDINVLPGTLQRLQCKTYVQTVSINVWSKAGIESSSV